MSTSDTLSPVAGSLSARIRTALIDLPGVSDVTVLTEAAHVTIVVWGRVPIDSLDDLRWKVAGLVPLDSTYTLDIRPSS